MNDDIKARIVSRLIAKEGKLSTSRLGRLRRFNATILQSNKLALGEVVLESERVDAQAVDELASAIGQLRGAAMKLGQLLGFVDTGLPPELTSGLWALQTHAQPIPITDVGAVLNEQLGPRARVILDNMDGQPLAIGSVGQIHRSQLPDGTPVAVKVQHPGIEQAIENDFQPGAAGEAIASFLFPTTSAAALVGGVRVRLLEECNYLLEAQRQQQFAAIFADHSTITVPPVHPDYCAAKVLTTTLADGLHLDRYLQTDPPQNQRDHFGAALFDLYVGTLLQHGLYNCDPHPGNYLFCGDGRLVALDFGCTRQFDPTFVDLLGALTLAVRFDDIHVLDEALRALGIVKIGQIYDQAAARELVRAFFGPMVRDETVPFAAEGGVRIRDLIQNNRDLPKANLPVELLFLLRVRVGLGSVLRLLGANNNWWDRTRDRIDPIAAATAATWTPTLYDVVLTDGGDNAIAVVREIREVSDLGIKEANALVESAPRTVKRALLFREAEALSHRLTAAGATAELQPTLEPRLGAPPPAKVPARKKRSSARRGRRV